MEKDITLVDVKMNDGWIERVAVENYDAKVLEEELNDSSKNMVAIGNIVAQRYSVIRITPTDLNSNEENIGEDVEEGQE